MSKLETYFLIGWLIMTLFAYLIMGADKLRAQNHQRRISEKALFLIALCMGGIGITAAMFSYRHKTKHLSFLIGMPIIIILNVMIAVLVFQHF